VDSEGTLKSRLPNHAERERHLEAAVEKFAPDAARFRGSDCVEQIATLKRFMTWRVFECAALDSTAAPEATNVEESRGRERVGKRIVNPETFPSGCGLNF
jgi:hypothetical protein